MSDEIIIPPGWSRVWTKDDWATPKWLTDALHSWYGEITLDPCWNAHAVTDPRTAVATRHPLRNP